MCVCVLRVFVANSCNVCVCRPERDCHVETVGGGAPAAATEMTGTSSEMTRMKKSKEKKQKQNTCMHIFAHIFSHTLLDCAGTSITCWWEAKGSGPYGCGEGHPRSDLAMLWF